MYTAEMNSTLESIRKLIAARDVKISEHGYDELSSDGLTTTELLNSIESAEIVEDYPEYAKGRCVWVLQRDAGGRPVHALWGIPRGHDRPAVLVTACRPDPARWSDDFSTRLP